MGVTAEGRCPRVLRRKHDDRLWVLSGFPAGSRKVNMFQKVNKNHLKIKKQALNGCSVGFSLLSGSSSGTQ